MSMRKKSVHSNLLSHLKVSRFYFFPPLTIRNGASLLISRWQNRKEPSNQSTNNGAMVDVIEGVSL